MDVNLLSILRLEKQDGRCSFSDSFSSIHWYYKLTITEGPATVSYIKNQNVEGAGYDSGEFDIRSDGSLIINNVSVEHEIKFTVYEYETDQESLARHDIDLITYIRPNPPFPVVDGCDIQSGICYIQWRHGSSITCRIQDARPAMSLTWLASTVKGDIQLNNITIFTHNTNTWTSVLTVTEPLMHSSYLSLLLCKAADTLNLLVHSEALVLVHNKGKETSQVNTTEVAVARNERIELPCIDGHHRLLVWEIISTEDNVSTPVIVDVDTANTTYVISREYELREGNLIISDAQLRHEGIYMCTYTQVLWKVSSH
ncbi:hypothetical protein BSL78_27107 [Apostichopus japonicus]|uniref:Ig-like domain-containing protein n=1 Tax=Stichopus japonicus TaxID=307972 RepID=A0A2G8JJY7_STIJA|nr:hypothetical protein BSL78_27107 [Apostichopus japonicus]